MDCMYYNHQKLRRFQEVAFQIARARNEKRIEAKKKEWDKTAKIHNFKVGDFILVKNLNRFSQEEWRILFSVRRKLQRVLSWYFKTFMEPRNRCQGINSASLCSLAGRYDNPIPTRCLAPIDFLKIPARIKYCIPFPLYTIYCTCPHPIPL